MEYFLISFGKKIPDQKNFIIESSADFKNKAQAERRGIDAVHRWTCMQLS